MTDYPENPGPLPVLLLRNSPEGKGALGNELSGRNFYSGGDRKQLVETVQQMLNSLGYDIGATGADAIFGKNTEAAVSKFQQDSKNWNGEALTVDGLVGPQTSDTLNRKMVGAWYDYYQTPAELTDGVPCYTLTQEYITRGLTIAPGAAREAKVFIGGPIAIETKENVIVEWPEEYGSYLPADTCLELLSAGKSVSIPWCRASVRDGRRRFVFKKIAQDQACDLMVSGGGRTLCLWKDQLVSDPADPPSWEHWLEEMFIHIDEVVSQD